MIGGSWLFVFDNHSANPFVFPNLPYDTEKDLDPVLFIGTAPYVLATNPSKPFKTLADVIAAARAKPDTVSYGSVGSGSVGHLAMVLLSKQAGVRLVHVPYRGGGPAMNDAIAGHVDLLVGSTALAIPQIQAGTIRAVAQTGKARTSALGTVPTVSESGFPNFEAYAWWGVFAPARMAEATTAMLAGEIERIVRSDAFRIRLEPLGVLPTAISGDAFSRFQQSELAKWGKAVRDAGIRID